MNADRWIALISLAITVVAVLFSIWAYKRGEKRRIPTVVTSPTPEVLVRPVVNRLKDFSVTHNGKSVGEHGVTAFFVYFWNDGQLPILRADVTSPYTISFPKGIRILNLAVTKSTRTILGIEAQINSNEEFDYVVINFAVLEPGDGLRLQVIFDGPSDTQVAFDGSCIGSAKVRVLAPDGMYFVSRGKRFEETYIPIVIVSVLGAAAMLVGGAINLMSKYVGATITHWAGIGLFVLFGFAGLSAIGAVMYGWYKKWAASSVPPEIRSS